MSNLDNFVSNVERKQQCSEVKKNKKPKIILGIVILIVLIVLIIGFKPGGVFHSSQNKVSTVSKSSLEKVLETSQLTTLQYTYNAIAEVKKEFFDTIKYHVAYEGTVQAGIDFEDIDIDINEEKKLITITLPEVSIQNVIVSAESMEYIFNDDKYESETVASEAYSACVKDLQTRAEKEVQLLQMAKDNARDAVQALIEPWVKQVDEEYTIKIL